MTPMSGSLVKGLREKTNLKAHCIIVLDIKDTFENSDGDDEDKESG